MTLVIAFLIIKKNQAVYVFETCMYLDAGSKKRGAIVFPPPSSSETYKVRYAYLNFSPELQLTIFWAANSFLPQLDKLLATSLRL